jgi:hypothetical protein
MAGRAASLRSRATPCLPRRKSPHLQTPPCLGRQTLRTPARRRMQCPELHHSDSINLITNTPHRVQIVVRPLSILNIHHTTTQLSPRMLTKAPSSKHLSIRRMASNTRTTLPGHIRCLILPVEFPAEVRLHQPRFLPASLPRHPLSPATQAPPPSSPPQTNSTLATGNMFLHLLL